MRLIHNDKLYEDVIEIDEQGINVAVRSDGIKIFKVSECIIMKRTGRRDSQGTRIYEGDNLECLGMFVECVVFKEGDDFTVHGYADLEVFSSSLDEVLKDDCIVSGNTHQNPMT